MNTMNIKARGRNTLTTTMALRTALGAALGFASIASARHEGDIGLTIVNGQITTNLLDGERSPPSLFFSAALGEFGIPGVGDEPGFDAEPGTFAPGSFIGFTIEAPLLRWTDDHFEPCAPDPLDGERMTLTYLSLSAMTGAGAVDGISLAVNPAGEWHYHFIIELLAAQGAIEPAPGAYLLTLSLHSSDATIAASEPFWILFNHALDEESFATIAMSAKALLAGDSCSADFNDDGVVDGDDLGTLLGTWGPCMSCIADFNGDGVVDGDDLGSLLGEWGDCS